MYPISGLIATTKIPLQTINIPNALGSFFSEQHSEILRFKLTKVAPRKNPIITNITIRVVPFVRSASTERPKPTIIEQIQNIDLFFNPSLSNIVGNVKRARMSVKAVMDKQKATSALVIPIDRQVSRGV